MGTHAKPRTRVRTIALGTLAVGATLTGVGLTAAALDPAGASLADGAQGGDPVDLAASGLGAPVPVADVSSLDGASLPGGGLSTGTLSLGTVPTLGTGAVTGGLLPGSATAVRPRQAAPEPTWAHGATVGKVPGHQTPQGAATGATQPSSTVSPASSGGNGGSGNTGGSGTGGGSLGTVTGLLPTGQLPLDQLSSSSVDTTLNQVAPGVSGNLTSGFGRAKSTVSGLLTEVAGLL